MESVQDILNLASNNVLPILAGFLAIVVGTKLIKGIGKLVIFGVAALLIARGLGVF